MAGGEEDLVYRLDIVDYGYVAVIAKAIQSKQILDARLKLCVREVTLFPGDTQHHQTSRKWHVETCGLVNQTTPFRKGQENA